MPAYLRGVPLRSAIIVRHTPNDRRGPGRGGNAGAVPMSMAGRANDYAGRYGDYRDKGGVDREPTRADEALMERAASEGRLDGRSVEYISRTGPFSGKGRDRQVDASLWDQHGPVDPEGVTREMRRAGGAFVDSLVSVKREHAAELGLETKEDFQRLMRATWSRAVEQWGVIRDPDDIRWVAAFHTDASESLHVHVHTWSARGEIEPGWTVPSEATRRAKAVVYEVGYASIRAERDARAAFLRDLSLLEARTQLGLPVDPGRARSVADRARRGGWPERLGQEPDLDAASSAKARALGERLSAQMAEGRGRVARNYGALATARDIASTLEAGSPRYAAICAEYAALAEAKAALKGYPEGSHRCAEFVRAELEERAHRLEVDIARAHAPGGGISRRPLPEHLRHLDARGRDGWSNVTFSAKLAERAPSGDLSVRIPGSRVRVTVPAREAAPINGGRAWLAAVEDSRAYEAAGGRGGRVPAPSGRDLVGRLGPADMDLVAGSNYVPGTRERDAARAAARRAVDAAENRFSVRHGMPLREVSGLSRDVSELAAEAARTGASSYAELGEEGRRRADRIAEALVDGSSAVRRALGSGASSYAAATGRDVADCHGELRGQAVSQAREAVARAASDGSLAGPRAEGGGRQALGALEAAVDLAEALAELGGSEAGAGRRGRRPSRAPERDLGRDVLREEGRSRG